MTSRDAILARVRAGLARPGHAGDRQAAVEARLDAHPRHLVPARTVGKTNAELVAIFRRRLEGASGEVIEVADPASLPAAVAGYLSGHKLPPNLRMGDDKRLAALPWNTAPGLNIRHGRADRTDSTSLTCAIAAVAETGTLVVCSGPANPVTLSFLPDTNIVVVHRDDIVGPIEEAWQRARTIAAAAGSLPRTVNFISGPSRSADIGGIPVLGAHGPCRLCAIIVC